MKELSAKILKLAFHICYVAIEETAAIYSKQLYLEVFEILFRKVVFSQL